MMRLMYSPANISYVFTFGEELVAAKPIRLVGSPMFFESRREAVEAAYFCGLLVDKRGMVSTRPDNPFQN